MHHTTVLFLYALATVVGHSKAREVVGIGPDGSLCPADVTVYIQQANLGPGNVAYVTVADPVSSSIGTHGSASDGSVYSGSSGFASPSSYSTSPSYTSHTTTRKTRKSRTSRTSRSKTRHATRTSTTALDPGATDTTTTPFSTPTPLVTYQPVSPPSTTLTPATVAFVTTDAQGHTVTQTIVETPLGLGAGLPSGTVSDISPTAPVILGFAFGGGGLRRRQETSTGTASGYMQGGGSDGSTGNSCAYASRFYLNGGMLISGSEGAVGKNRSDLYATIAPWPYTNEVTTSFTFENGFLVWRTADLGSATFYQCGGGPLLAGFPYPPYSNCSTVAIGGIASAACPVDLSESATGTGLVGIPVDNSSSDTASATSSVMMTATSAAESAITTSTIPDNPATTTRGNIDASTTIPTDSASMYTTTEHPVSTTTFGEPSGATNTFTDTSVSIPSTTSTSTTVLQSFDETTTITSSVETHPDTTNSIATSVSVHTLSISSTIDTEIPPSTTATTSGILVVTASGSVSTVTTITSATLISPPDDGNIPSTVQTTADALATDTITTSRTTKLDTSSTTTSSEMMSLTTMSTSESTTVTSTTSMTETTITTVFDPNVTNPANRAYNGMVAATAPVPPESSAYCPVYDNMVVASNGNTGNFFYQIYCDADIGGGDAVYPDGYSAAAVTNMDECIKICTVLNDKHDGYCQAVAYLGPGQCYPKTNIYQQTNDPVGRGTQYNYYFSGRIAAQLLDQTYPNPTDTKAVGPGTTIAGHTTTTTAGSTTSTTKMAAGSTTSTTTAGSGPQITNPGIRNPPAVATAPVAPTPYSQFDTQVIAANYNDSPYYGYQIFRNANIGGSDITGTPPGYVSSGWPGFDKCLELCAAWNAVYDGYCQAVIYLTSTLTCYPQQNIYEQTDEPAGRGFQYAYFDADRTAAQLLDQTYPRPTQTKPS